ncbi:hypothetical protein AAVH_11995 [Aphelenchoides avenae]|nr:hypothetical protein AAVH_11995 [Aphelenchus avenae]
MYVLLVVSIFFSSVGVVSASDSARCLLNCISGKQLNDTSFRDMGASHRLVRRSADEDGFCGMPKMLIGCITICPKDKGNAIVLPTLHRLSEKYCTSESNETALREFVMETREFGEKWSEQLVANSCLGMGIPDIIQSCKVWTECTFGKALDAVKDNFSEDVIAVTINTTKFLNALFVEAMSDEELPQACDALFEPYSRDGRQQKDN